METFFDKKHELMVWRCTERETANERERERERDDKLSTACVSHPLRRRRHAQPGFTSWLTDTQCRGARLVSRHLLRERLNDVLQHSITVHSHSPCHRPPFLLVETARRLVASAAVAWSAWSKEWKMSPGESEADSTGLATEERKHDCDQMKRNAEDLIRWRQRTVQGVDIRV